VVDVVTEMTAMHHAGVEVAGTTVVVTTRVAEVLMQLASPLVVQADRTTTVLVVVMTTAGVKRLVVAPAVAVMIPFCYDVFFTYWHCSLVAQVQKLLTLSRSRHFRQEVGGQVGRRTSDLLFQHFP